VHKRRLSAYKAALGWATPAATLAALTIGTRATVTVDVDRQHNASAIRGRLTTTTTTETLPTPVLPRG
jgi:hypothetical protein